MNYLCSCFHASAQSDEIKNIEKRLPLTSESLDSRGLYVYDDGFRFILWFGRVLSPDIAMNLLGADFAAELSKVRNILSGKIGLCRICALVCVRGGGVIIY